MIARATHDDARTICAMLGLPGSTRRVWLEPDGWTAELYVYDRHGDMVIDADYEPVSALVSGKWAWA